MKQTLQLMPSVALAVLHGIVQRLVLPLVAIGIGQAQADVSAIQAGAYQFFDSSSAATSTCPNEKRMLRHMIKFYEKLQEILRRDGPMSAADKARTVCALVAGKTATLRACGVPFTKINALLIPMLDITALLRPR